MDVTSFFRVISAFEDFVWEFLGFPLLLVIGLYFCFTSRFIQIRKLHVVVKNFFGLMGEKESCDARGVHPIRAFFACVGGCIGIGNIVSVCAGVQIGGPGALFWMWCTAIIGMMVKYAEVYVGILYRVKNNTGGYDGGPMYFIKSSIPWGWVANLAALLLCVYGVEILQFSVVVQSISSNLEFNKVAVASVLLILTLIIGNGGVSRVGTLSSFIIPLFVFVYLGMSFWVLFAHWEKLPDVFLHVFQSAFTSHAAVGGFVGSSLLLTISQGVRSGCYTGDIAVGYASVISSETSIQKPEKQAALEFIGIFLDTFLICTSSVLIILAADLWHQPIDVALLVQTALEEHFDYMYLFMPFFLFLLGTSTINAYFLAGLKCAEYLSPKFGRWLFNIYAAPVLFLFAFLDVTQAKSVMGLAGGLLLVINLIGIYRLRKLIVFKV